MEVRETYLELSRTYLIDEKENGEKWPHFVLGDQILTGLKF